MEKKDLNHEVTKSPLLTFLNKRGILVQQHLAFGDCIHCRFVTSLLVSFSLCLCSFFIADAVCVWQMLSSFSRLVPLEILNHFAVFFDWCTRNVGSDDLSSLELLCYFEKPHKCCLPDLFSSWQCSSLAFNLIWLTVAAFVLVIKLLQITIFFSVMLHFC